MNLTKFFRCAALLSLTALAACGHSSRQGASLRERDCLARAMYFESNRSSDDGMLAVGTVVMNRLNSGKYPNTICGVVGQKKQFAPGVLSKPMKEGPSRARAERMADAVMRGKRHRGVGSNAMFFHTAGYNFPYRNMHYQVIAGGNAFYEKRTPQPGQRNRSQYEVAGATPRARPARSAPEVQLAEARRPAPAPRWAAAAPAAPPPVVAFSSAPGPASIEDLLLAEGY
jgi:spore germination cell wall hydrolase CwlJ-like protein